MEKTEKPPGDLPKRTVRRKPHEFFGAGMASLIRADRLMETGIDDPDVDVDALVAYTRAGAYFQAALAVAFGADLSDAVPSWLREANPIDEQVREQIRRTAQLLREMETAPDVDGPDTGLPQESHRRRPPPAHWGEA